MLAAFVWPKQLRMDVDGGEGGGTASARRRRERRLRMHWRHEQLSLRMALAAATHHSAQPRAGEEKVHEKHDGLRAQKRPSPVERPAPLLEVRSHGKLQRHAGIGYVMSRISMFLRRRWWTSCRTSCISSARSCLFPSRLSKCPRIFLRTSLCERLLAIRSWWNSWWKCRRSYPIPAAARYGAERRYSSSWSWRAKRWSSRFSP